MFGADTLRVTENCIEPVSVLSTLQRRTANLPLRHFQWHITVFDQICFIPNNRQYNIRAKHFLQFFHPIFDFLEGILIGDVVYEYCAIGRAIINRTQSVKSATQDGIAWNTLQANTNRPKTHFSCPAVSQIAIRTALPSMLIFLFKNDACNTNTQSIA